VEGEQSKFPATISLYGACSEDILVQRSLGYYVWTGKFLYPERKSCGFKNIQIRVDEALDRTFALGLTLKTIILSTQPER